MGAGCCYGSGALEVTSATEGLGNGPCAFCAIVERQSPARIVFESRTALAFFPTTPATTGHTLLIPKRHIRDLWDFSPSEDADLVAQILPLARALRSALRPDGFNVINSAGVAATQSVPHFHIHLLPRWYDDGFGPLWPAKIEADEAELDRVLESVRDVLHQEP